MLTNRFILYGEWLYAKHSVHYRKLPHYFFEFDTYDKDTEHFLNLEKRLAILEGSGLLTVPVVHRGPASFDQLRALIGPSAFGSQFENPTTGRLDDLMEGLYCRTEANGHVSGRAKMVRPEFVEKVKQSEHWQHQAWQETIACAHGCPSAQLRISEFVPAETSAQHADGSFRPKCPLLPQVGWKPWQDAQWHAEGDVWTHTRLVCAQLERLTEWATLPRPDQLKLFFAALFHDAGKPLTSAPDPETGLIRSPKHSLAGAEIARQVLRELGCDLQTREEIVSLVRYHGRPPYFLEKESPEHELIFLSWFAHTRLLYWFALTDTRGRHTKEMTRPEDNLHLWKMVAEERGCFDNAYPGADYLKRLLPDAPEYAAALRHYCAYGICRELANHFGEHEIGCWVRNMVCVGACFVDFIKSRNKQVPEHQLRNLLWSMFSGGIGSTGVAEFVRRFAADMAGLDLYRTDLLAMANNEPLSSIHEYVAVCSHGDKPEGVAWEQEFLNYMADFRAFQRTGRFPDGWTPSAKLLLVRLLIEAGTKRDFTAMEQVLTQILADYPQDAQARQLYAQLLERTDRQERAWAEYERAATLDSRFQLPLFSLTDSKSRAGRHQEALAVVDRISAEGVGPGSRSYIRAICLIRVRRFIDVSPLLFEAYENSYEPGTCACVLFWLYGRFAEQSHEAAKQEKRWRKIARHHGMPIERVIADLGLG